MNLKDLIAKMDAIEEAGPVPPPTSTQPQLPAVGGGNSKIPPTGPAMPNQPTNQIPQNVKPQADRPGLDPSGDPKLYDVQLWLQQNGYKDIKGQPIKPDGLNGDKTKFAYDQAMNMHNGVQNAQYPTTADASFGIGKAIGSGVDWIGTAWRNLKQGFNSSSPSAPPSMEESMKTLAEKLRRIDENVEECGAMPMPGAIMSIGPQAHQGQQDNVSMTINVNGQGEGGLRSIMNILRDIEAGEAPADGDDTGHEEPIMGADESQNIQGDESPLTVSPDEEMDEVIDDDEEGWGNSAHGGHKHHTHGLDAVTFSGDDMNSKGKISPVARVLGTNALREPSQFDEALVQRLTAMYQEIKEADDKKTMSRAAKGVMKYGKDGMQALAKAGKEGKSLDKVRAKYNKYDEAYNPNSAGAEHARGIKASHKAELEKKAKAGDESAKKQLKSMNDRDEQMRNDYNARMER